ncbi:MAG: PhzF family phenazine biosynthesis protein [Pseudomonadota bacterium]
MSTFQYVDVFSERPFLGNPVAVVMDTPDISTDGLLRIAQWLNLSETTFLAPPRHPDADYRVRIFTLEREMPFAGHPTLGSAHAWLEAGGQPKQHDVIVQECGAGLVRVRRDSARLAFAAPPLVRSGAVDDDTLSDVSAVLNIDRREILASQWCDNGPGWVAVLLDSAERVKRLQPRTSYPKRMEIGVLGPYPAGHDDAFEVRALFSDHVGALREDPVTGSLNAAVSQWMLESQRITTPFRNRQGSQIGRDGVVHLSSDAAGTLWVGGATRTRMGGDLIVPDSLA